MRMGMTELSEAAEDLTYRFEVLLGGSDSGERWMPYSAAALGLGEHEVDSDYSDDRDMPCIWQEPTEFARAELDQALGAITAVDPGLSRLVGLRVLVWEGLTTDGEPVLVLRATAEQLALGRLRYAAAQVHAALQAVEQARRRLRAQVIEADTTDRLGRNRIAREIEAAWTRRLILRFLGGHDLIEQIRRALPADWSHHPPFYETFTYGPAWEQLLEPSWCGPVVLHLAANGQVQLEVIDLKEPPWWYGGDAGEEEVAAYQAQARQRMLETAELVIEALPHHGLQMVTSDGRIADAVAVAGGRVLVGRSPHDPRL